MSNHNHDDDDFWKECEDFELMEIDEEEWEEYQNQLNQQNRPYRPKHEYTWGEIGRIYLFVAALLLFTLIFRQCTGV